MVGGLLLLWLLVSLRIRLCYLLFAGRPLLDGLLLVLLTFGQHLSGAEGAVMGTRVS